MLIKERVPGDLDRLRSLAAGEKSAEQKDRWLSALHAASGEETAQIQKMLLRSRGFVQRWAYAYRDGGIDALQDRPRGGSKPKINGEAREKLRARLEAGPLPRDRVCVLRGADVQRIVREELGVSVGLSSVYRTLESMGYVPLAPRPRHEKQDPAAQQKFKEESAPFLSRPSAALLSLTAGAPASTSWTRPASASRGR
jgi:transposase